MSESGSPTAADLEIAAAAAAAAAETAARIEAEQEAERLRLAEEVRLAEDAAAASREVLALTLEGVREWLEVQLNGLSGVLAGQFQTMMERLQGLESLILALPQVTAEEIEEMTDEAEAEAAAAEAAVAEEAARAAAELHGQPTPSVPEAPPESSENEPPAPAATKKRVRHVF
jgi:hypothetical protein